MEAFKLLTLSTGDMSGRECPRTCTTDQIDDHRKDKEDGTDDM
jgi:hypothetical protein